MSQVQEDDGYWVRPPLRELVAGNVRAECARQGLRPADIASLLMVSRSLVSQRWNNKTAWQVDELEVIAECLGIPLADLLRRPASARGMTLAEVAAVEQRRRSKRPRRDSNAQPADYTDAQVIPLTVKYDAWALEVNAR